VNFWLIPVDFCKNQVGSQLAAADLSVVLEIAMNYLIDISTNDQSVSFHSIVCSPDVLAVLPEAGL